jgi:hypothetical protein
VLSLAEGGAEDADELEVEEALRRIASRREGSEPWQRDDATVRNMARSTRPERTSSCASTR